MSESFSVQFGSFVDKLQNPSTVDALGGALEIAKNLAKSSADTSLKPLISNATIDSVDVRKLGADQAAEAAAVRARISSMEANSSAAQATKRVLEEIAATKEANAARLEQLANQASGRALSAAERLGAALDMAKQLGAVAGLLDIVLKGGESLVDGKWDPVGEVSVGVLAGYAAGVAVGVAVGVVGVPTIGALALSIGVGYAATKAGEAYLWPLLREASKLIPNEFWDRLFSGDALRLIAPGTNAFFLLARNWTTPRDPLVLDLDGDGIETLAINPAAPILFDMDADGVKTGTGWIKPDDALVVLDRNGNGLIDSGSELFGDSTVLQNGPKAGQKAANGFEALADLDANADGVINSADAAYANLRLWQDANQDGISQSSELKTLATLGIASINVVGTPGNVDLGGGNTQVLAGSFTRTSGQSGTAGVAELAGSLLLAGNGFYREFTDDPVTTAAAVALPGMRGSGLVRDLRPAMSLGTAQAQALQAALAQFALDGTRAQQMAHLDGVIQSWGATNKIAACARATVATGQFGHKTKALRQSPTQRPCRPVFGQYGLRCARLGFSRRAQLHEYFCDEPKASCFVRLKKPRGFSRTAGLSKARNTTDYTPKIDIQTIANLHSNDDREIFNGN